MIDKATITIAVGGALLTAARVVAQSMPAVPDSPAGAEGWSQLGANGAMIVLVLWMVTKTFPAFLEKVEALTKEAATSAAAAQKSSDEKSAKEREFFAEKLDQFWDQHEKDRERFICKHPNGGHPA